MVYDGEGQAWAADLAAEIMSADRTSAPIQEDPPPNAAMGPVPLMLYPLLRRYRRVLAPLILTCIVVAIVVCHRDLTAAASDLSRIGIAPTKDI